MGLELFISWQAVVLAAIVVTVTAGVKTLVCLAWKGCKKSRVGSNIVLPMIPLVLAALAGAFIPLRPEAVVEYVSSHTSGFGSTVAYAAWGFVAAGIFGAWLFDRAKDFVTHGK
jgi:hypothetical protein